MVTVMTPHLPERRRANDRLIYSKDQLLGRAPIRLRRRADKQRLVAHLVVAAVLSALSIWWVVPLHDFAGPVMFTLSPGHGVHRGDLATVVFLAIAGRSLFTATQIGLGRVVQPTRSR